MQNKNIKETIEFKNIDISRASNGTIEKKFHGGSTGGYYIGIEWKVNSQSTSNNSSNVTATTFIRSSGNGYTISSSASKTVSITIDGSKDVGNCTVGLGTNTKKNLISKTMNVSHDSNGNKTCSFACALDINITLSGTSYGKISHSGSGVLNQINLNSAPSMSGSLNISPNGTVPENTSSLTLSWNRASDAQNNVSGYHLWKYVNNQQVWNGWIGNVTSYNDPISSEGQGSQIHYVVQAKDSYNLWSNQLTSAKVTKNKFAGASIASFSSNIVHNTNSFVITLNKASNTNGNTSFNYYIYSDEITIYNAREITGTTETITIWKSGATPSTPYIKFEDLKNRFNNSGFNGKLQIGVRTTNAYGTRDWKATAISVDLRTQPTPATPSISQDASLSTALVTIATTNNKYFIPNTGKKIRITWSGGSDILGQTLSYEIQVQLASGGFVSKQTTTNTYYDLELPKQSSTQNLVVRVITKTSYNYTAYKDTPAIILHYYNPPSVSVVKVDRTDTTATAKIKLNANTSIPNVNFTTRTYAGVSSGTLQNTQNEQSITASNLSGGSKYTWTITINDDTKLNSSNVTSTVEVPAYTPLFSVREKGVGINAIPDGSAKLVVNGGTKITGGLTVDGKKITGDIDTSNLLKKSDLASASNYKGKVANIGNDGVMEIGKYIDFHNHTTNDYDSRITCDGDVLTVSRHLTTGGNMTVGGTIIAQSHISLPSNGGSWLNGATNGNIRGSKQSTGSYHPIISQTTSSNHKISLGGLGDEFGFHLYDANRTENGIDKYFRFNLAEKKIDTDMRLTIYDNWLYTTGNNGWYNSTHGGGWFMQDSTWVRSYNSKSLYTGGGTIKTEGTIVCKILDDVVGSANSCYVDNANGANSQITLRPDADNRGNLGHKNYTWNYANITAIGNTYSIDRESTYNVSKFDNNDMMYDMVKNMNFYLEKEKSIEEFEEEVKLKQTEEYQNADEETQNQMLRKLEKTTPASYYYSKRTRLVANADELPFEVAPESHVSDGSRTIETGAFMAGLASALQKAIEKIEMLENKVEELEYQLENIESN